jgi:hypothetical protein
MTPIKQRQFKIIWMHQYKHYLEPDTSSSVHIHEVGRKTAYASKKHILCDPRGGVSELLSSTSNFNNNLVTCMTCKRKWVAIASYDDLGEKL